MRTRTLAAPLLGLTLVLAACSSSEHGGALARIKQRGELTWGADLQGGEPYVWEDPANPNHIVGFEVDIADAIARRLGVRARFVQYNWSNLVPSLERGDFDRQLDRRGIDRDADHPPVTGGKSATSRASPSSASRGTNFWSIAARSSSVRSTRSV